MLLSEIKLLLLKKNIKIWNESFFWMNKENYDTNGGKLFNWAMCILGLNGEESKYQENINPAGNVNTSSHRFVIGH